MSIRVNSANAVWEGGLQGGKGHFSASSGTFTDVPYTFATRFGADAGTNPEELIGAAHAACFSMALSAGLEKEGSPPTSISTRATVFLEKTDAGPTVRSVHLDVIGVVPGIDAAAFEHAAQDAKSNCPISRLLKTDLTIRAKLEEA